MSELLEFLLNCLADLAFDAGNFENCWRFGLPVLGALGVVLLIHWTVSNSTVQCLLSLPASIAGVITGIVWQVRKG